MKQALAVLALGLSLALAQGKITVWTHFGGPELEWLKAQAQAYEKTSGTKVEVVEVPFGDIKQKFILGAPQGQAADLVVSIPHDWLGEMAQAGVLEPMGKYVTQSYLSDLQSVAVEAFTFGGKLMGLPAFAESVALIYNKKYVKDPPPRPGRSSWPWPRSSPPVPPSAFCITSATPTSTSASSGPLERTTSSPRTPRATWTPPSS